MRLVPQLTADAPCVVPPELLARPSRDELRHLDHDAAALELDRYLRLLARQEAVYRRVLGRLAGTFLRAKGAHRLGFARLGDYTRERLDISAREMQSVARVAAKLDALPAIAAAFDAGEISWTHARHLIDIATPENEAASLALARDLTVRALASRIHAAAAGDSSDDGDGPRPTASAVRLDDDEDSGTIEGEPEVRVALSCPRRLRALWRSTVELARRMAGEPLPVWQACEAIAAEGLSAATRSELRGEPAASCCAEHSETADRDPQRDDGDQQRHRCRAHGQPHERRDESFPHLDWRAIAAVVPRTLAALDDGIDDLDAFALDARLRAARDAMQRVHWQTGRLLRLVFDLRLYRWLGFETGARYVRERLGISIRTAQGLIAVDRVTARSPQIAAAYEAGAISWLRALTIAPAVSETHEAAWLARAREVTLRRLSDEVGWALAVQDVQPLCEPVAPPPAGTLEMPNDAQMRARCADETPDVTISFRAPMSVVALFRQALAAYTRAGEPAWRGFERLLDHVLVEWLGRPKHRDPVFARDGWRCAVPACSARRNLHDHRIVFRSRGGGNARDNRIALCAAHHHHGIHAGYVRAWGEAPDGIHWELGTRAGAPPLMMLIGDRYMQ